MAHQCLTNNNCKKLRFNKSLKLNQAQDFRDNFRLGKKLAAPFGALYVKPNLLDKPRLGLVVAKKNIRSAVKRNLIRRIIRENFRLSQQLLAGLDIVVTISHFANRLDKTQLHQHLDTQWQKLVSTCKEP